MKNEQGKNMGKVLPLTPMSVPPLPLHLVKNFHLDSPVYNYPSQLGTFNTYETQEMCFQNPNKTNDSQVNYRNEIENTNTYSTFSHNYKSQTLENQEKAMIRELSPSKFITPSKLANPGSKRERMNFKHNRERYNKIIEKSQKEIDGTANKKRLCGCEVDNI